METIPRMDLGAPGLVPAGLVPEQTAAQAAASSAAAAPSSTPTPASSASTKHAKIIKGWEALRAFESISSAFS
eukprot:375158-Prorocentrum_lima.AAC.1